VNHFFTTEITEPTEEGKDNGESFEAKKLDTDVYDFLASELSHIFSLCELCDLGGKKMVDVILADFDYHFLLLHEERIACILKILCLVNFLPEVPSFLICSISMLC
jgi:hypothetical protein